MDNDPELEKLNDLGARIRQASGKSPEEGVVLKKESMTMSRIGFDFIGMVLGGAFLGWLVDRSLGTKPWIMMALILVGFGVGIFNMWRALSGAKRE